MGRAHKVANMLKAKTLRKKDGQGSGKTPFSFRGMAIFLLAVLLTAVGVAGYVQTTETDVIVAGVRAATVELGGLTPAQVREGLSAHAASFTLQYADTLTEMTIAPAGDGGAGPLATFDIEKAADDAFAYGHAADPFTSMLQRLRARVFGIDIPLSYTLDEDALADAITDRFGRTLEPAKDARLIIEVAEDGSHRVTVEKERDGATLNLPGLLDQTRQRLDRFSLARITVSVSDDRPTVTEEDVLAILQDIPQALDRTPLTLKARDDEWTLSRERAATWLAPVQDEDGNVVLGLHADTVMEYLASRAEIIDVPPKDAVFAMEDGKVTAFEPNVEGEKLDIAEAYSRIEAALLTEDGMEPGSDVLELPVVVAIPTLTTERANPWGIGDVLGVGESNFRGSPLNRRKNIAVGAGLLNGVVVMPGDELSLLTLLKPFDATNGYLEELVIKENETKPEYGGGLCQIGTTTFRAALAAGLPITARQNHSYRVPYYERDGDGNYMGPGIDATIYDPAPDFRFLNDTGHPVILMTEIIGNKLQFTIWGKADGRKSGRSEVRVWNVQPPPEKKIVKTTSIPPGTEKCTESPHSGADTSFTYTITYANGETKEQTFTSKYRPWGEVCLQGVTEEELAAEEASIGDGQMEGLPSADTAGVSGE